MGVTVAEGVVSIRADIDGSSVVRSARTVGDRAGSAFTRGMDGRLRDMRGRFVSESRVMGRSLQTVGGAADGFTRSLGGMTRAGSQAASVLGSAGPAGAAGGGVAGAIGAIAAASALPAIGAFVPMLAGMATMGVAAKLAFSGVGDAVALAGEDSEAYAEALEDMSPAQREFTKTVVDAKKGFAGLGKEVQAIALPSFTEALKQAKPAGRIFRDSIKDMSEVLAGFGEEFGKLFASDRFQKALRENLAMGADFMGKFAEPLTTLTQSFLDFGAASKPTLDAFGDGFANLMGQGIPEFFEGLKPGIEGSAKFFGGLFDALNLVLPALGRLSGALAETFGPLLGSVARFAGDLISSLMDGLLPALNELSPTTNSMSSALDQMTGVLRPLIKAVGVGLGWAIKLVTPIFKNWFDIITILAPHIKDLGKAIAGPLVSSFGALLGGSGAVDTVNGKLSEFSNWAKNNKGQILEVFRQISNAIMDMVIFGVSNLPNLISMFRMMLSVALNMFEGILFGAEVAFGWIPGIGGKLKSARSKFSGFKDGVLESLDKAERGARKFSDSVVPKLEKNKLKVNISNWEAQLKDAKAQLKTVPKSKRADLLARIKDLQAKVKQGKADLKSVPDKTAKIFGDNRTGGPVRGAKSNLGSVKDKTASIKARNLVGSAVGAAKRLLGGVHGKTVTVTARFIASGARKVLSALGFAQGGLIPAFRDGGMIPGYPNGGLLRGPGTGTSDSILARVSNGEFVVRAAAVRKYGPDFFDALNDMRVSPSVPWSDMSLPGSSTPAAVSAQPASVHQSHYAYNFQPGSIVLDASKLKDIQDVVEMINGLKITARQFGAREF